MTRRKQAQARAAARARDGSVPFRRTDSMTSSRGLSAEPNENGSRSTTPADAPSTKGSATPAGAPMAKIENDNTGEPSRAGTKRAAGDVDAEDQITYKKARTENAQDASMKQVRQGNAEEHQREISAGSEAASWLNTPEPEPQDRKPIQVQPAPPSDKARAEARTTTAPVAPRPQLQSARASTSSLAEPKEAGQQKPGFQQRVSAPGAVGSSSTANAPSKFAGARRKSKDKMKPFSLAATLYTPLPVLKESRAANFIGVVVSYRLPTKAHYGTGDYNMNINIVDPWCYTAEDRISINLFAKSSDQLPAHISEGMVILLRQVRMGHFNGKLTGTVFKEKMNWCTHAPDGQYKQVAGLIVHRQERDHLTELSKWYAETYLGQQGEGTSAGGAATEGIAATVNQNLRRTITLDQLQEDSFYHCVAEVVRVFASSERPEIYITDWTTHPQLQAINNKDIGWNEDDIERLAEQRGDNGGGSVLKITLWDEQVNAALALQPGHFVHLRNLRCKRSALEMLEGSMGGIRTQRDFKENKWQIQKLKKSDPLLESLLKRKDKAAEELEMDRALAWPESGESAERVKEEVEAPAAGASGNGQHPESLTTSTTRTDVSTKSEVPAQQNNTDVKKDISSAAANQTASERPSQDMRAMQDDEESVEASQARRMRALTEKAAQIRAAQRSLSQDHASQQSNAAGQNVGGPSDQNEPISARVDKGKAREMPSSLPLSDSTNSHSTQHSSVSSLSASAPAFSSPLPLPLPPTLALLKEEDTPKRDERSSNCSGSTNGTPSVLYSLPPPGQQPRAPPSSHPSASQLGTPAAQPLTSTPLNQIPIYEEHDSDLWTSDEEDHEEDTVELRKQLAQQRADEVMSCRLKKKKVTKMRDIAEGVGIDAKHHVRGRIVDTIPRDLSRWVKARCKGCNTTLPDTDNFCAPCADEEGTHLVYEWWFALIMQDEDASFECKVPIIVAAENGAAFFPDFDPAKHHRDVKAQRKLRERLVHIFGAAIDDPDHGRRPSLTPSLADDPHPHRGRTKKAQREPKLLTAQDDVSLNPIVDLAVYAFRMAPTGKAPASLGEIKCKVFGTEMRLKSSRRA
ncbi:unnamed protein product [Tilletia controversa]|uniref:Protection of telomeres protein 1 n=1 Tax=Tilletia controversa TaxID=13291 RepID=A0A8X7N235_9BASI|nr:hypothetical protein CF328_g231 [Tilletia controversa]KAE8256012.1 hypothetical protein A4X06_0g135 [Tilletia controversa]CAD6912010.1 unnamed protein product [Tilletia controversa]CAD6928318.1 unnamed protein product [Tilletia controversa]CAD6934928.1 unnamed protein product [Tilletia controversa]